MKIEKDTFKGKRADLIFSVPLTSHPKIRLNIFILLEHKAHYDKELHSQCLGYQVLMREHHLVQFGCAMPTSCVLFYHGKQTLKWSKTLQIVLFLILLSARPPGSFNFRRGLGCKLLIYGVLWPVWGKPGFLCGREKYTPKKLSVAIPRAGECGHKRRILNQSLQTPVPGVMDIKNKSPACGRA